MPIAHAEDHVDKRLSARERLEPEAIARLRSEAALLALLSDLGVTPRLLASGEDELGPWHRIERVRVPTLSDRLARAPGPLATAWIERAVRATLGALASLHEAADTRGPLLVVHADLSPANVAIDDAATRAVLLDLDLAWWRDGPSRLDGAFRGTIAYVAPEVARGEPPTAASDLFALAATLLHGVNGVPPRDGPSFAALLAAAAEAPLLDEAARGRLAAKGPGHAALAACLAHDPAHRPASARAALAVLDG
ncbi:MAG: hypothetical protein KF795_22090 [Labilithrix sp.]|nr:hypothetical protein [Labilithrix sp.]